MQCSDVLVLGAGPAGVSAAVYALRGGASVTVLYRDGGALERAESVENYYGFPQPVTGKDLFLRGLEQVERLGAHLVKTEILGLSFGDSGLVAQTEQGDFAGKTMVLATGASRSAPKIPGIREFDGMGVSYCAVCDGFFCRGRDVAVLGAGAYALHEAQVLLPLAASVTLLPQGQEPELPLPEGLRVDSRPIGALEGTDGILSRVRFEDGETFPVDRVFVALGTAGSGDLARKLGIVLRDRHVAVQPDLSTNIPGLFAAGDCIGGLLQVAKAAADGARAGLSCLKYLRDNR